VAAVGIEQSRTEQKNTRRGEAFFCVNERNLLTAQDQSEHTNQDYES
jgi:hypothetical protein